MPLVDTDLLVAIFRGDPAAVRALQPLTARKISIVTYMELIRTSRNHRERILIQEFLSEYGFEVLPLTTEIGSRAAIYVEERGLRPPLSVPDALVAATATQRLLSLCSRDATRYRSVSSLILHPIPRTLDW